VTCPLKRLCTPAARAAHLPSSLSLTVVLDSPLSALYHDNFLPSIHSLYMVRLAGTVYHLFTLLVIIMKEKSCIAFM
jgi:hypothetical protein